MNTRDTETKSISQFAEIGFGGTNQLALQLASYEPLASREAQEGVATLQLRRPCSRKQRALPPGICISTGLYFFDIELYAVTLRPSSPSPSPLTRSIRPCAKLRAASTTRFSSSTALPVSSLHILANLRISILSLTAPQGPGYLFLAVTCIDITIQWPPRCWGRS